MRTFPTVCRRLGFAAALAVVAAFALDRAFPPELGRLEQMGAEVTDREGRLLSVRPAAGGVWRLRTGVDDVSPAFLDLLIATEDRRFYDHPGIDPIALARAAVQWVRAGRIVSGGSTLTMQTVRLLSPRPRTVRSKLIEIARAVQLEAHYSKRDILGMWLTLAPFGGNIEGVRAGALAWFGVPARQLEPAEAALLVAIPRRPEALRPDRHADQARAVRDRVLPDAAGQPVPEHRVAFPRHAPQPTAKLAGATTLDLRLQAALERLADGALPGLPERASMAIVVADARAREIRAIYGGAWGSEARSGALDLSSAVRSPGSALKPFIYALAFQDGITSPDAFVTDAPRHFGGYAPEDFDRHFAGRVTAAEALRQSLNLPAVALLDRVGPGRYAAALRSAGIPVRLPGQAGASLPLALGGLGVTPREVASLYAALATDGAVMPLKLSASDAGGRHALVEPAFARMVADVLTQSLPGESNGGIAWKTGTSWGGRDAWAAGFDAAHVVVVWVGRPDGTPLPGATGRALAVPMLARVFSLLQPAPRSVAARSVARVTEGGGDPQGLRVLFPPPGAVLSRGDVLIRAMGGRRPLTFLVDGAAVSAEAFARQARWSPASAGFYQVTVLDADGASARASVRVRD